MFRGSVVCTDRENHYTKGQGSPYHSTYILEQLSSGISYDLVVYANIPERVGKTVNTVAHSMDREALYAKIIRKIMTQNGRENQYMKGQGKPQPSVKEKKILWNKTLENKEKTVMQKGKENHHKMIRKTITN